MKKLSLNLLAILIVAVNIYADCVPSSWIYEAEDSGPSCTSVWKREARRVTFSRSLRGEHSCWRDRFLYEHSGLLLRSILLCVQMLATFLSACPRNRLLASRRLPRYYCRLEIAVSQLRLWGAGHGRWLSWRRRARAAKISSSWLRAPHVHFLRGRVDRLLQH